MRKWDLLVFVSATLSLNINRRGFSQFEFSGDFTTESDRCSEKLLVGKTLNKKYLMGRAIGICGPNVCRQMLPGRRTD